LKAYTGRTNKIGYPLWNLFR